MEKENHPRTKKARQTVHWQAKRGAVTLALSTETHAIRHKEHQWTPVDGFGGVCCLASRCLPSSCPPDSPPRFLAQTLLDETSRANPMSKHTRCLWQNTRNAVASTQPRRQHHHWHDARTTQFCPLYSNLDCPTPANSRIASWRSSE